MVSEEEKIKELKEKNKLLKKALEEKDKKEAVEETNKSIYYGIRFVQVVCIGFAVFGALWHGTEVMQLTQPEFMMVYGTAGALISEIIARVFKKKMLK